MSKKEKIQELEREARGLCIHIAIHTLLQRPYMSNNYECVVKIPTHRFEQLKTTMERLAKLDNFYKFISI